MTAAMPDATREKTSVSCANGRVRIRQVCGKKRFAGEEPDRKVSVAGCRIGGTPFVVRWKAVIGTARNRGEVG
jgi:hypothetical protein